MLRFLDDRNIVHKETVSCIQILQTCVQVSSIYSALFLSNSYFCWANCKPMKNINNIIWLWVFIYLKTVIIFSLPFDEDLKLACGPCSVSYLVLRISICTIFHSFSSIVKISRLRLCCPFIWLQFKKLLALLSLPSVQSSFLSAQEQHQKCTNAAWRNHCCSGVCSPSYLFWYCYC